MSLYPIPDSMGDLEDAKEALRCECRLFKHFFLYGSGPQFLLTIS